MAVTNAQKYLEEYRSTLLAEGCDLRLDHWKWHKANAIPRPPADIDPGWGMDLDYGTEFLEMHHMMLYAEHAHGDMPQGLLPWLRDRGYPAPAMWDGKGLPPRELDYTPPQPTGTDPSGKTFSLARRADYPPADAPAGYPLPACFTEAGTQDAAERDGVTAIARLGDFRNVNQLGCCIAQYHNWWHYDIGGAMKSFYFCTDDPVFFFGVHWAIEQIYAAYQRLRGGNEMECPMGAQG